LARLRAQGAIPPAVLARLETFLTDYHAARFGGKKAARENLAFPGPALPGADQGGSQ
jgi:hypothetical protein